MKKTALIVAIALAFGPAPAAYASDTGTNYKNPQDMLAYIVTRTDITNPWYSNILQNEVIPAVAKAAPTVKNPKIGTSVTIDQMYAGTTLSPAISFPNLPPTGFNAGDAIIATSGTIINCNSSKSTASITVSHAQESTQKYTTEQSIGSTVGVGVSGKASPFGIGVTADTTFDINVDESWTKSTSKTESVSWDVGNDIDVDGGMKMTFAAKVYNLTLNQIPADVNWQFTQGVVDLTLTWFASDPSNKKEPEKIVAQGTIQKKNVRLFETFSGPLRTVKVSGKYTHSGAAAAFITAGPSTPVNNKECPSGSSKDKPKVVVDTAQETKAKAAQLNSMKVVKTYKLKATRKPK